MAKEKFAPIAGSIYHLHPAFAMEAAFIRNLPMKTGKTIEEWIAFVNQHGPPERKERVQWLKSEHNITTNYAKTIAEWAEGKTGSERYNPEAFVEEMYADKKSGLRPVYEALLKMGFALGEDVKACPCKTFVPFYRNHVFAQIKPATLTRIDMGFALKDTPVSGRLIDTGGFAKKDRITHRIPITSLEEIGDEVKHWLQVSYEMDG